MTAEVLRRSPLEGARLPGFAVERPFLTHLTLRLRGAHAEVAAALGVSLPETPCTFTSGNGLDVLWMGPDEYLIISETDHRELESSVRETISGAIGAVCDVSAQRTTVDLSGAVVRDVLAHGCSIDLHPSVSPPGTCVQTLLARTGIVLLVRENDEFTILVRSSFAEYFAAWLVDASTEYEEVP